MIGTDLSSFEIDRSQAVIAAQLGRPLRAVSKPLVRCHLGLPVVIEVPPVLDDGTPFPTHYWLSCPLAVRRVARIESRGDIGRIEDRAIADPEFGQRLTAAHERYRNERDVLIAQDAIHRPSGGVAGASFGVKCLHATMRTTPPAPHRWKRETTRSGSWSPPRLSPSIAPSRVSSTMSATRTGSSRSEGPRLKVPD